MLKGLFLKEVVLLVVAFGAGAGLAAALPRGVCTLSRVALAPVFGFAAIVALLTTVNFFVALEHAFWFAVLPLVAISLLSVVVHIDADGRRRMRRPAHPSLGDVVRVGVVALTVLTVYNLPLDRRNSQGPIAYAVHDAPGYVACVRGFAQNDTSDPIGENIRAAFTSESARTGFKPAWSLTAEYCDAVKFLHNGSLTLPAAVAPAVGWDAWTMVSPFAAVLAALAALGALALFVEASGSRSWWGVGAGLLSAGPVSVQLYVDGSVGYMSGLAILCAFVAVGIHAVERPRWRTTILLAVLAAGMQTSYPEIGVVVTGSIMLVLLVVLVAGVRRGASASAMLRAGLPHLLVLGALSALFAPRAAAWAVANASFASEAYDRSSLPAYLLRPREIIGWLLQTREFYSFATREAAGISFNLVGIGLPLTLIAAALWGMVRVRRIRVVLALIAVASAQALYLNASSGCSYCVDRSMLVIAPVAAVAVMLGLRELGRAAGVGRRELAGALACAVAIAASAAVLRLEQRAVRGAYMPGADLAGMVSRVRDNVTGTVQLEGFSQTPWFAYSETPTVYAAMQEATSQRVSMVTAYDDYGGLSYLHTRPVGDPSHAGDYEWVVSRLTTLDSGREEVARTPTMALWRRTATFDAVLVRGVAVDSVTRDPAGTPWLQAPGRQLGGQNGPLTFWVSARSPSRAFLRVTLSAPPDLHLRAPSAGSATRKLPDGRTEFCVPVPGSGPTRIVKLDIDPLPAALGPPPVDAYAREMPDEIAPFAAQGVRLDTVGADARSCPRGSSSRVLP